MITCKICNQEFKSIISWKHLKKHNLTVSEYTTIYGAVMTDDYKLLRRHLSTGENNPNYGKRHTWSNDQKQSIKGRPAPNKGIAMSSDQKEVLREKALQRHETWRKNGTTPGLGKTVSEETKEKIRKARTSQIITSEQATRAIETKKNNGYDIAFFRGKSHTIESKEKIAIASKNTNVKKTEKSHDRILQLISSYNLSLVGPLVPGYSHVELKCNICDTEFKYTKQYFTNSKTFSDMCPTCYPPELTKSFAQQEIYDFIHQYHPDSIYNYRKHYHDKEIDIYIPSLNLGFEYNGLYWHSEIYKDKSYHINKTNIATKSNIRLIHIFEDEWINNKDIVKSRIKVLLNVCDHKIFARKCKVKILDSEANIFLNKHHIQGSGRSNVKLGLYYNGTLVSVMTFLNNDISKNVKGWELNRFCTIGDTIVVGGASKLFNFFIREFEPTQITSFADARWSSINSIYLSLGFEYVNLSVPNYWYITKPYSKRFHRYSLRKPINCSLSEIELRHSEGYLRIWDCGSYKFLWSNKKAG